MFHFFRRRDSLVRWFMGGLLMLICLMLVVTLIPGLTSSSMGEGDTALGKVCGEQVSVVEVQRRFQQMTRGRNIPANMLGLYAPQILEQMMTERAVLCEAQRLGLRVTETELVESLRTNGMLYPGGQFIGAQRYRDLVETQLNMTVPQFEIMMREQLLNEKLRRLVTDGVTVGDGELDRDYRRSNDKVKVDYVFLKATDFTGQVKPTEAELQALYQKNKAVYRVEEKRSLKYVYLNPEQVKESIEVTDAEIRRFYEQNRDNYRGQERVQAAHILLKTVDKSPEDVKQAEKKINDLLKQARSGSDFAELAKKNSEDVVTSGKGGDLGWVVRGQMVPEFEKVAFATEVGTVGEIAKTQYGFHIVKVTAKETARLKTLDEVRVDILKVVKQEKSERMLQNALNRLEGATRKFKDIPSLAAEMKLPVLEAKDHSSGGNFPVVGANQQLDLVVGAAKVGEISNAVTVGSGSVVFRVDQITPARLAEFAEVRAQVEGDLRTAKASELMQNKATELAVRAREMKDLKKAAASLKLTVKTSEAVGREEPVKDVGNIPGFPADAFKMPIGAIGGPLTTREGLLIFAPAEQLLAKEEDVVKNRESRRKELILDKRDDYFALFRDELRERLKKEGKITTNEAALRRLTGNLP